MVVRINSLANWEQLDVGANLLFRGNQPRKIRVEFNTETKARVDAVPKGDKPVFVATIDGHETVEFVADGDVDVVVTSEGEVWYAVDDGSQYAVHRPDEVSFTKIATRRARNPELERLMWKQQQNIERRLAALQADMDARIAAMGADPETGEIEDDEDGAGHTGGDAGGEEDAGAAEPPAGGEAGQGEAPAAKAGSVPGGSKAKS